MTMTESLKKAQEKYNRESTRKFSLKFNKDKDADVIKALEASGSIQGYIRSLIRADIANNKQPDGKTPLPEVRVTYDPEKEQWEGICSKNKLVVTSDSYDVLLNRIRKKMNGAYTVITESRTWK